jgi:hypothetical protein
VREADNETLIIADGFSCREQIAQTTDRRALHLAEVIQIALRAERGAPAEAELAARNRPPRAVRAVAPSARPVVLLATAVVLAGGAVALKFIRGRSR